MRLWVILKRKSVLGSPKRLAKIVYGWAPLGEFLSQEVWGPSICISIKFPVICSYWTKNHSLRSCCHPLATAVHCLAHSRASYTHSLIFNPHRPPVRMDWQVKETCLWSETRRGRSGLPLTKAFPQGDGSLLHTFFTKQGLGKNTNRGCQNTFAYCGKQP